MIKKSELTKEYYKTGELAKMIGKQTRTVQSYCIKGDINSIIIPSGKRIISRDEVIKYLRSSNLLYEDDNKIDLIYARVSTNEQKNRGDLDRQIDYIIREIIAKNPKNLKVFSEVGSGLNDNRTELKKLLDMVMNDEIDRIFILYKDRLTRFGFNYLEQICNKFGTKIIVISEEIQEKSIQEELAEDIISIIHSFSGKLYGMRNKIKEKLDKELSD
ncbi:MAG: IS607 family transposase [Fusobacterium periodonticum]|jgi:DNA binding domain, excisionase family|nr:IS607 family transposase [Fusobacterium periodonticum]